MSLKEISSDVHALLAGRSTETGARRRSVLQSMVGLGYAAAAAPLMAQTAIATPADGLTVGEISYTVDGFKVPAYRAAPAGKTGLPVVLVVHEIFGVHEYIADTCRRLAHTSHPRGHLPSQTRQSVHQNASRPARHRVRMYASARPGTTSGSLN